MTDKTELATNRSAIDSEIVPEHDGGAVDDGHEAGAGAQQRGLPGTVWSRQEHHLASPDVEVDAREGGEASKKADGGAEVDSEAHASGPRLPGGPPLPPRRPAFSSAFRKGLDAVGPTPVAHPPPEADDFAAAALAGASAQAGAAFVAPPPAAPPPERRRIDLASVLSATGRTLIALGLLILGFVAFELLGTNVAESRHQASLRDQLTTPPPPVDLAVSQPSTEPGPPPAPDGSAVARIRIPRIGVDKAVVEGVALSDLRRGPGHYSNTPLPGQPGNASIAGHRTTYGAPFFRLDEMKPGDPILVSTVQGAFRYEVRRVFIVKPDQVEVLNSTPGAQLTLTTCNPRFSAAQRLVLVADLRGPAAAPSPPSENANPNPAVAAAQPVPVATEVVGASGDPGERVPSILWGTVVLALGIAAVVLGRLWRRWPAWLLMAAPFLAVLWTFYTHLAKAVPS